MRRDLKSFMNALNNASDPSNANQDPCNDGAGFDPNDIQKVQEVFNQYQGLSQDELESELFRMVEQQKQSGNFNPDSLANMASMLGPMMNDEQRKRLSGLLGQL